MAVDKDKVLALLGTGLQQNVVAAAVGCEPQYITELLSNEDFKNQVIALRQEALTASSKRDKAIDGIEDDLIDKLKDLTSTPGMLYKPHDILKAFMIVNNAKRRGAPVQESLAANEGIAALSLPVTLLKRFSMTKTVDGEIVQVEEQSLVAMPAHTLLKVLADNAAKSGAVDKYSRVARYLPAAIEHGVKSDDS